MQRRQARSLGNDSSRRRRLAIRLQPELAQEELDAQTDPAPSAAPVTASPQSGSPQIASPQVVSRQPAQPYEPAVDASDVRDLAASTDPLTWVFTGDAALCSHRDSNGTFPRRFADWVKTTLGRADDVFVNATFDHARIAHVRYRMQLRLEQFTPHLVTILCGLTDVSNDSAHCRDFEDQLIGLIRDVRAVGAIPIVSTPPCPGEELDAQLEIDRLVHVEAIRGCAKEHAALIVDHWLYWENRADTHQLWDREAAQPTPQGVREMANLFITTLGLHSSRSSAHRPQTTQGGS